MMQKIAILCSGGDVSGMNAAIKRFVEYAFAKGLIPYFIYDGFEGMIDNRITKAGYADVAGSCGTGRRRLIQRNAETLTGEQHRL